MVRRIRAMAAGFPGGHRRLSGRADQFAIITPGYG